MEWKQIQGKWNEMAPQIQRRWNKLTQEDVKGIAGNREHLMGKLRERYGLSAEDAEKQVKEFSGSLTSTLRQ